MESAGEEGAIDVPARSGGERRRRRRGWLHFQPKQNLNTKHVIMRVVAGEGASAGDSAGRLVGVSERV